MRSLSESSILSEVYGLPVDALHKISPMTCMKGIISLAVFWVYERFRGCRGAARELLLDPLYPAFWCAGKFGGHVTLVVGGGRLDLVKGPSAAKLAAHH